MEEYFGSSLKHLGFLLCRNCIPTTKYNNCTPTTRTLCLIETREYDHHLQFLGVHRPRLAVGSSRVLRVFPHEYAVVYLVGSTEDLGVHRVYLPLHAALGIRCATIDTGDDESLRLLLQNVQCF